MNKNIVTVAIASLLITSCNNTGKPTIQDPGQVKHTDSSSSDQLESLKTEASRLRGGGSIKKVELDSGIASIHYVSDYKEYRDLNPQSTLSESELKAYWENGDAIKKALVDGSVRLLRKLDYLNAVNIVLPVGKQTYAISVSKQALEKFIGKDFKTITDNWDSLFSDPYVYDKKGRDKFFSEFGSVK